MNYLLLNFIIALWIETITSFSMGIFILIKGTQKSHKLFATLSFIVGWWSFCQIWMVACDKYQTALFWGRIGYTSATFIAPLFLHFVISFLQIKNRGWFLRIVYFFSSVVAWMKATKYGSHNVVPKFYTKYFIVPEIAFHLAITIYCICVLYSFWKLFEAYKNSAGEKRNQLKYLFWIMVFGFTAGTANFLLAYNINIPFSPFLTYLGSVWPLVAAYAILRYHMMDINIVIKKTAVYSILVTMITVSYFILIYIVESFFRGFVGYKSISLTIGFLVVFTLLFQPLKNIVQSFIDKYFFKTSQTVLADELQKAQEELKRTERLKAVGTLAAGMAHEIKNPLTGIKTFTEYLPEKYNEPGFIDKFHKIVSMEVNKINDIVQQLLDFSKPKPLKLQETNIHQIIDQTLSLLSNSLIKYKIKLVRDYDTSLPSVNIDINQIQQVFCNLFLNAIEAMKTGGELTITTTKNTIENTSTSSHAEEQSNERSRKILQPFGPQDEQSLSQKNFPTVQITISDTGKGIAKKDLEHIFDPFYTTKETGTGLGMSIIYGIIKEHKGTIEVESKENKETNFRIKLPLNV